MATALDHIETAGGIAVPNFFNGRILSAEDLRLVMAADRRHRTLVGRALGPGIADGLRVSRASGTSVTVTEGVAVNRHGEVLDLPTDLEVRVAGSGAIGTNAGPSGSAFEDCGGSSRTSSTSNAFLLTIRPDSIETGSAPADPYLTGASCGPGFLAEGVRFRRVPFDPAYLALALNGTATTGLGSASPLSRNVVSHLFLGSGPWTAFSDVAASGDLDPDVELAHQLAGLQPCEVPLALFYLHGGSVAELDEWSVRRPSRPGTCDADGLDVFTSPVRAAAGAASYRQFQAQLEGLLASGGPSGGPRLTTHFRHLPAAAILPAACIGSPSTLSAFLGATMPFFSGFPVTSWSRANRTVKSARVEELIRAGTQQPPVDLVTARGLPLIVVAVAESLAAGNPYAVVLSASHPYRERVDLDLLTDRVAVIEPPAVEEPKIFVVKQTEERRFAEDGYRLAVNYSVVTNTTEQYRFVPIVEKRANAAYVVSAKLGVPAVSPLAEGATVVAVEYAIRHSGFTIAVAAPFEEIGLLNVVNPHDDADNDADAGARTGAGAVEFGDRQARGAAAEGLSITAEVLNFIGPIGVVNGVYFRPDFTFGLEVSMVEDPGVVGRTDFPYWI